MDVPGQCCGKCQQTHCIIKRPGTETIVLKVRGEPRRLAGLVLPLHAGGARADPEPAAGPGTTPVSPAGSLLGWVRLCKGPGVAMTMTGDYRRGLATP